MRGRINVYDIYWSLISCSRVGSSLHMHCILKRYFSIGQVTCSDLLNIYSTPSISKEGTMQGAPPPFHREPTLKYPLYYVSIIIRGSTIRGFTVLRVEFWSSPSEERKKKTDLVTWWFQVPYFHNAVWNH